MIASDEQVERVLQMAQDHGEHWDLSEKDEHALEAVIRELEMYRKLLNTPETEQFDFAVPLEAGHQQLRWGAEHDSGKNPEDWFWLIGYLAGKALSAQNAGDKEKAKHHTISTAAACRNWHQHLRSGQSEMRPGISAKKQSVGEAAGVNSQP